MIEKYGDLFWRYINDNSVTVHCIVGAVSLYAFYRLVVKKKYKLPPGPRGLPLLGNLLAFQNTGILERLNEWQKKYGDIITVSFGPMNTIVISDADLLIEAFVTKSSEFSDRPFFYSIHVLSEGSKSMVASSLGTTLKYQRKVASQSLRQYLTGDQLQERCHEVTLHMAKLIEESKKEPILLKDVISFGTFNVLHGLVFGSTKEMNDPYFQEIYSFLKDFSTESGNGFLEDIIPLLRYWPTKKFKKLTGIFMRFLDYIEERIAECKADLDKASPRCLTDSILIAQQELMETDSASLQHMTDVHARQIVSDVFGAGIDTSRLTMEWIFLVLVAYPDIQARMQEEIDNVVGQKVPSREHRAKLVYTEAVILETMRLYAVAPLGVPHQTKTDATIGGYEIPAKTSIMVNQHLILRDPKHWENPLEFKPERFLSEDGTKVSVRNRSFIPFSVGPRACPGEGLAKLNIVYLVVGLLQKCSFSLPPGEEADFTPNTNFFGYMPHEYKVVVKSR